MFFSFSAKIKCDIDFSVMNANIFSNIALLPIQSSFSPKRHACTLVKKKSNSFAINHQEILGTSL